MKEEKRRVPKLRFPGFTEDWEQRKLGSIGSTYTGLSGKTKEDFGHGEAQYITYLNVFQNTVSDITMTDKVEIDTTQNEVKYGDVLFTTSSETPEEVGMSSVWLGVSPNTYLNSFCFGFRPNQKINPYFLGYSLRSPYMRNKIKILAQGISRYNISKNKVMELEISVPNNEEQKLLGAFLQRIDLIITLHQRKLENLKLKKKALLQKLFPRNGECYPELRFPGFTDAWEQRKFLDLLDAQYGIRRGPFGSSLKKDSFVKKSDYVVYEQQNAIYDNYETRYFISKEKYNELIRFNIQPGDFIMSGAGTIGRISMVPDGIKKGVFNQALIRFKVNKDSINPLYFLKFMQSDMMQKQLTQANPGSAMTNLVPMDELKKWDVTIPSLEEQNKISTFINQIDEFITLHQRKLEHLQLQKKALLQQMFV
ncbi:restriction endonuclease subunit S [Veillonella caviae]|uniref:restriction endonuclease subunit S n=1 Tax=Veillonella caviae TaxID=248316 RepID=UPI000F8E8C7D|nr:restriction endonuclease subunit S [Veillonella caviae]